MSKVIGVVKLQLPGGEASSAPPAGPALEQYGVDVDAFADDFNAETADYEGEMIPVVITVYEGGEYSFVTKEPPAATKRIPGLDPKGTGPNPSKVGPLGPINF